MPPSTSSLKKICRRRSVLGSRRHHVYAFLQLESQQPSRRAMEGIPDEISISKAAELTVFDSAGKEVKFGDLFEDKKTILVFIRASQCCRSHMVHTLTTPPARVL